MSDEDCPQIKSVTKRGERSDQRECVYTISISSLPPSI